MNKGGFRCDFLKIGVVGVVLVGGGVVVMG